MSETDELPSNWGRWGDDDELGTLNLITDEVAIASHILLSVDPFEAQVRWQGIRLAGTFTSGSLPVEGRLFVHLNISTQHNRRVATPERCATSNDRKYVKWAR